MSFFASFTFQIGRYLRRRMLIYAVIIGLFSLGSVLGGIAVNAVHEDEKEQLSQFINSYVSRAASATDDAEATPLGPIVTQEMIQGAALPWLLGLSVLGAPLLLALVFLKGFALGFTLLFLFNELSHHGILFIFAGVLPHSLLKLPALFLASGSALTFAAVAGKILIGRQSSQGVWAHLATTTVLSLIAALLIAGGTWIQEGISPVFIETVAKYVYR